MHVQRHTCISNIRRQCRPDYSVRADYTTGEVSVRPVTDDDRYGSTYTNNIYMYINGRMTDDILKIIN